MRVRSKEQRERDKRILGTAAFLWFLLSAPMFVTACATLPSNGTNEETQAIIECAKHQDCFIVHIDNQAWAQTAIYVNGTRFTTLQGKSEVTLPLERWRLDGGGCAQVFIKFLAGDGMLLPRECIKLGGHFTLDIFEHLPNSVFTAWR